MPYNRSSSGFTLVELLVVIVIIATLAALLLVGFSRMRASGDRAGAIAAMRQLAVANTSYSSEHNGQFVPIATKDKDGNLYEWYYDPVFRSYLTGDPADAEKEGSKLRVAPAGFLDPVAYRSKKKDYDKLSASYGFNSTGLGALWPVNEMSPPMSYKVSQIANPSRTAFIISATDYQASYTGRYLWKATPVEGKTPNSKIAYRHDKKAIVIYYDGSTGLVSMADILAIDSKGGANNPFWKATP